MARTPYLALDPGVLEANLAAMADACRAAGVALRPHVKGPKSPWVARRQLAHGAVGVAAATLDEAEAMVDGGIEDVLITSVLAPGKVADAVALARRSSLAVVVHTPELARALGTAARGHVPGAQRPRRDSGDRLDVLLDVDVGQRRGGASPEDALAVAAAVAGEPELRLAGVQGYEGHLQAIASVDERRAASHSAMDVLAGCVGELRAAGHAVPWVTTGGTGTALLAAEHPVVTEVQPGSYTLMDTGYAAVEGLAFGQALHVVTAVTAVLGPDEVIVDAGLKALGTDAGAPAVLGRDAVYAWAGDEHGRITGDLAGVRAGDQLRLVPAHSDTTVDRHAAVVLPDGTEVPVTARSR